MKMAEFGKVFKEKNVAREKRVKFKKRISKKSGVLREIWPWEIAVRN